MNDQTIGILHCGDMGAALAGPLRDRGIRVVSTDEGRSSTTCRQARNANVEILPTLAEVAQQSDIVLSIVLPSAAIEVARRYSELNAQRPPHSIFVDLNSVGLEQIEMIRSLMQEHDISFVDGCILGAAHRMSDVGVLNLSGPDAPLIKTLCQEIIRTRILNGEVGAATRLKILMTGISKSLISLFLEVSSLADREEMLDDFLQCCQLVYPGVMQPVERSLPTYPRHAGRRISEIANVESLADAAGMDAGMTRESRRLIEKLANIDWPDKPLEIQKIIQLMQVIQETKIKTSPSNRGIS